MKIPLVDKAVIIKGQDNKPQHTPTPWFYSEENNEGLCSVRDLKSGRRVAQAGGANAAFIVKAVNCHEELLEVLRDAVSNRPTTEPWIVKARKAIAKAERRIHHG